MARTSNQVVFREALLPEGRTRWGSMGAGLGLQFVFVSAIVVIPMLVPQRLEMVHRYWTTPIEAPVIEAWKPQPPPPQPKPKPVKHEVAKVEPKPEPVEVAPPKPKIINPVFTSPIAKPATAKKKTPAPDMPDVAKAFPAQAPPSMGSSAIPTLKKPKEAVQTGGFGDPNGVPTNAQAAKHSPNIAVAGSYDLPPGPGYGNGTGGAKGARGIVASTGFGNGVATGGNSSGPRGTVQQGVFADEKAAAPAPKVRATAATSNTKPVEILFKPRPQYTDEARAKKIEGEVLLQVIFTASGEVRVQRVVQGLGYGLDDSAESAARQIRFHPAQQGGQPVDSTAIVHIVFELAY
jgi:TonB family protein